jgi:hypothetical protein
MERNLDNKFWMIKLLLLVILSIITEGLLSIMFMAMGGVVVLYLFLSYGLGLLDDQDKDKDHKE